MIDTNVVCACGVHIHKLVTALPAVCGGANVQVLVQQMKRDWEEKHKRKK